MMEANLCDLTKDRGQETPSRLNNKLSWETFLQQTLIKKTRINLMLLGTDQLIFSAELWHF